MTAPIMAPAPLNTAGENDPGQLARSNGYLCGGRLPTVTGVEGH